MPIPVAAIAGGLAVGRSLFGNKKRFKYPTMDPFSFNPNEEDSELLLLRRRAMEEAQRGRGRTVNEIGRAGLLGTSAAFSLLDQGERGSARQLEDIDSGVFARRRSEALDQYNRELDFRRQISLAELGSDLNYENSSRLSGLASLGDIGEFLGSQYGGGENEEDLDYFDYLRKKKNLPGRSLFEANDYSYIPQGRRGIY